jgi:serine/threonine protein kinase
MAHIAAGAAPDDLPDGYRLIRRIATDGLAEVWEAEAPGGFKVAVHVGPDRGELELKRRTFERLRQFRHPYLLALHGFWAGNGKLIIVTELADGNLHDRLKECLQQELPGIPVGELIASVHEAAAGLDYLHGKSVVFRDVKPQRLLQLQGHVKLDSPWMLWLAANAAQGDMCGTPRYMAPEGWQGKFSPMSDQYSLAVSYFELRTGQPLLNATNIRDLAFQHLEGKIDLSSLPKAERSVLQKALAKEAKQRYPTCVKFAHALRQASSGIA